MHARRELFNSRRYTLSLLACLICAVGSPSAGCPIDLLTVSDGLAAWAGLQIGSPIGDITRKLGHPIDLTTDPEWPGQHAQVLVNGRQIFMTLHMASGDLRLSSMLISRVESDDSRCWDREFLVTQFKRAAPKARYLPSRHDFDRSEGSSDYPMYALDDRQEVVVLFKPSHGTFYVGHLGNLD